MRKTIYCSSWTGILLCLFLFFYAGNFSSRATDMNDTSTTSQPIRVACVGDSITYGHNIKNRKHNSYPAQLGRLLGSGWDVRNFGVNGATLLHDGDNPYFRHREYTNSLDFKPDIVVIMLGTNDSKHRGDGSLDSANAPDNWRHKANYIPDCKKLIASYRKVNPAVKIYVCLPTPCFPGRWGINNKTIRNEIIPMIREVASETHVHIINLNQALSGKADLFPDTVHPNKVGAGIMAETIYHALAGKTPPDDHARLLTTSRKDGLHSKLQ
jgi:acyl-CoA thioesterase I